jgi:hypothetical protein
MMGVRRRRDYIILGVDVGYETFEKAHEYLEDEAFQEMESYICYNEIRNMTIIPDWEENRGCFVGLFIDQSDEYAGFERVNKVGLGDYYEKEDIVDFVYEMFDKVVEHEDVKVIIFTQWL